MSNRTTTPAVLPATWGQYDELLTVGEQHAAAILAQFGDCLQSSYCVFDKKARGSALNYDLYGYCPAERVAVIQARQAFRMRASHYMSVRKTYLLCGHNENGEPFRHPVGSAAVRNAAIAKSLDPAAPVRAAQRWMWGCTDKQLAVGLRQGDILLVAERGLPKGDVTERGTEAVVANSHRIRSPRIVQVGERVYAQNPTVRHDKAQHEPVCATDHDGWYSVRVAHEASAWNFAPRTAD